MNYDWFQSFCKAKLNDTNVGITYTNEGLQ